MIVTGSPTRARTWDLRINSPSLYRLSYRGTEADYYSVSVKSGQSRGYHASVATRHRGAACRTSARSLRRRRCTVDEACSMEDDDRTVLVPARAGAPAPAGGSNVLPPGTKLREFEITGLIGEGGFGIVYLALGPFAAAQGRAQGIHAVGAGRARRGTQRRGQVGAPSRDLRGRAARASSTKRACWPSSTIRRWSRSIASGRRTAPPTW